MATNFESKSSIFICHTGVLKRNKLSLRKVHVNRDNDAFTTCKNFVNFDAVTPEMIGLTDTARISISSCMSQNIPH